MANSSIASAVVKPQASQAERMRARRKALGLHPDFPLFAHDGRWAKKVRGKLKYFGKVDVDPKGVAALDKWNKEKDDLIAGRTPRAKVEGVTIGLLCSRFLEAKDSLLESGEITVRTRADYYRTAVRLTEFFGKDRLVSDLASDDFEQLRSSIAKKWGPVALGNEIQRVRVLFKHGFDASLILLPVRFGPGFKRPSKKVLRKNRREKGAKFFEAEPLRRIIETADVQLRAMILLAVNTGCGNSDVGTVPLSAMDLDGGWLNYHRPKTEIDRRCPLWPETVAALRAAIEKRTEPKDAGAEGLVFVTRCGLSWAKETSDNPVAKEFRKLLIELGLHRNGLGFYSLRHTFRTVADESRDQPACNSIMGHADASMAGVYRERISDERLRAVADYVRAWLFPQPMKDKQPTKRKPAKEKAAKAREAKPASRGSVRAEEEPRQIFRIVG